ncbi:MAG: hypothetical protein ACRDGD_00930 [Candidatus Limnocylindria bacterium]
MAQAQSADRAVAPPIVYIITAVVAVVAGVALAAILAWSAFGSLDLGPSSVQAPNPALLESGARWELRSRLQSGDLDPLSKQGREWERQRHQQSPFD